MLSCLFPTPRIPWFPHHTFLVRTPKIPPDIIIRGPPYNYSVYHPSFYLRSSLHSCRIKKYRTIWLPLFRILKKGCPTFTLTFFFVCMWENDGNGPMRQYCSGNYNYKSLTSYNIRPRQPSWWGGGEQRKELAGRNRQEISGVEHCLEQPAPYQPTIQYELICKW